MNYYHRAQDQRPGALVSSSLIWAASLGERLFSLWVFGGLLVGFFSTDGGWDAKAYAGSEGEGELGAGFGLLSCQDVT